MRFWARFLEKILRGNNAMELTLHRITDSGQETLGVLDVDAKVQCRTLEDTHRDIKIPGDTRIPAGRYKIIPRVYGKFYEAYKKRWGHKFTFEIEGVPNYTHILIHTGTDHLHTAGCVLVGTSATEDSLIGSRDAYSSLYDKISASVEVGDCYITIVDEGH